MSLEENAANRWNSPPHFQLPEQQLLSSRFIRLKTSYWNKEYAIVLLGIIGLFITSLQFSTYITFFDFMRQQNKTNDFHQGCISYNMFGYFIALIPGGVLATIFPAHNILGISIAISSIGHLIVIMSYHYLNSHIFCILQFCIGTAAAVADVSIDRVWTYWVPLNKQLIRHIPMVFYMVIFEGGYIHDTVDKLHDKHSSYTLTLFIGVIGLAWYVLWLYAINGNYSFRSLNSDFILFGGSNNWPFSFGIYGNSLPRSIVSDIPWKSIFTSKPFLAIVLLYVCDYRLSEPYYSGGFYGDNVSELTMREYTVVLLLLFVILIELVPEITTPISTTNVRKFWSCFYFGSMGIFFILEAILGNTIRSNIIYRYLFIEMRYLYNFGFYVNTLDIAPKYASLLSSFLLCIHYYISHFLWFEVMNPILSYANLNKAETDILMTIISFAAAVIYAIYASAEIQSWADEPVEENQQNMIENDN